MPEGGHLCGVVDIVGPSGRVHFSLPSYRQTMSRDGDGYGNRVGLKRVWVFSGVLG